MERVRKNTGGRQFKKFPLGRCREYKMAGGTIFTVRILNQAEMESCSKIAKKTQKSDRVTGIAHRRSSTINPNSSAS